LNQECELRLSLAPDNAQGLWRCHALRSRLKSPRKICNLSSIYFDTPDADLWRKKLTLCLRREAGRWIQTLSAVGSVIVGAHQHDVWEMATAGRHLELDALENSPISALLTKSQIRCTLAPQTSTRFKRSLCTVELAPGCIAQFCFDQGELIAGERLQPFCEVELALITGQPARLFSFALELLQELPFRLELRSKAERAHALLFNCAPSPLRAHTVCLEPAMTPFDAMRATVRACLNQLTANEAGLLADEDPEYLHQARVALRRLLAALSVYSHQFPVAQRFPQLLEGLDWLSKSLGSARDWDVFVGSTLRVASSGVTDKAALRTVKARALRRRQTAHKQAADAVTSIRYTALLITIAQLVQEKIGAPSAASLFSARTLKSIASGLIEKRYQRVLESSAVAEQNSIDALHRLRINVKKLRYVAEFFRDLYPKRKMRSLVAGLARLQEDLGALNDAANAARMCDLLRKEGDSTEINSVLTGISEQWSGAASEKILHLPEAWRKFSQVKRFWFGG